MSSMKKAQALVAPVLGLVFLVGSQGSEAKGCIKGAAVGAVAGHVAGHHAVVGAAAGCVIGHHIAKKQQEQQRQLQQQQQQHGKAPAAPGKTESL
jgi:hypothetical protein